MSILLSLMGSAIGLAQTNQVAYTITDIGVGPGDTTARTLGMNNRGDVVGITYVGPQSTWRAFAWTNGVLSILPPITHPNAVAYDINDSGQTVGYSFKPSPAAYIATIWNNAIPVALPPLSGGGNYYAQDINNSGVAVGTGQHVFHFQTSQGPISTFSMVPAIWTSAGPDFIKPSNFNESTEYVGGYAICINNPGQVVGVMQRINFFGGGNSGPFTFIWDGVSAKDTGYYFNPWGMNDLGDIAGSGWDEAFVEHGVVLIDGVLHKIGTFGGPVSYAWDINNHRQVVGRASTATSTHAFLWQLNPETGLGEMVDLNDLIPPDSGWELVSAEAINDSGQVAGSGFFGGQQRAFLLTPKFSVEWESLDSENIVDANPIWNKGRRYFPDKLAPSESSPRNKIRIAVRAGPSAAGRTIHFKSFDVDDQTPTSAQGGSDPVGRFFDANNEVDPNGSAGNDNFDDPLATPKAGVFVQSQASTASAVLDANGEASVEFQVGMQPGNNYRIAATIGSVADLDVLQVTDDALPGYVTPDDRPVANFNGSLSPMLTIWRKLHLEIDSMEAVATSGPDANFEQGTIKKVRANDPILGQSTLELDIALRDNEVDHYENGRIEIEGVGTFDVVGNRGLRHAVVIVKGLVDKKTAKKRTFRLIDDDDRYLSFFALGNPLPKHQSHAQIVDAIQEKFVPAYIELIDATAKKMNPRQTIPFDLNEAEVGFGFASIFDDAKDLTDEIAFWAHTVVFAYQPERSADNDPSAEESRLGGTPKIRGFNTSLGYSVIYTELIREQAIEDLLPSFLNDPNNYALIQEGYNQLFLGIVTHETGHSPGHQSEDDDHLEGKLMVDGGAAITIDFSPSTIKRFRNSANWSK